MSTFFIHSILLAVGLPAVCLLKFYFCRKLSDHYQIKGRVCPKFFTFFISCLNTSRNLYICKKQREEIFTFFALLEVGKGRGEYWTLDQSLITLVNLRKMEINSSLRRALSLFFHCKWVIYRSREKGAGEIGYLSFFEL